MPKFNIDFYSKWFLECLPNFSNETNVTQFIFLACKNPRQIHPVAAQNNILKKTTSQWNVKQKGLMRHAAWVLWPDCFSQVSFTKSMHTQSFTVEVCVIDKNDNVPVFLEESMRGSVQLRLLKGGWEKSTAGLRQRTSFAWCSS